MSSSSNLISHYFPSITPHQNEQFSSLFDLYKFWNHQINVISRKDFDHFYERHVLHSLGIAAITQFAPGTKVLDVGTGGGFPGIPLAIMFPETDFLLVDSIGKKIKVVNEVAQSLRLINVNGVHERAEKIHNQFHFVVSRAVTQMKDFYPWVRNKFLKEQINSLNNGILYLKGGNLTQEMKEAKLPYQEFKLTSYFKEEFFETKAVIYVPTT